MRWKSAGAWQFMETQATENTCFPSFTSEKPEDNCFELTLPKPKEVISRTEYDGPGLDVIVFVTAGQLFTYNFSLSYANIKYYLQLN